MPAPPPAQSRRAALREALIADLAAIAVLGGYVALLLRASVLRGGAMIGFDLFNYFYPAKTIASEALRHGQLPLWNPSTFFGAPFLANVQMAVLYPPDLLFLAADFPRALAASQWLHLTLGAAGMYLLCRKVWRLASVPATCGAVAFAGGGFFGAHMGHLNQVHAGIWLPWIALIQLSLARALGADAQPLARRLLTAWPWAFAGGVVVALQLTAGHTQETYYSLLSLALLSAGFLIFPPAHAPHRASHALALPLIAMNGFALAAAQLVPTVELAGLSYRQGGVPLEEAVAFGIERTYLLESLLPTFWSLPAQEVTGYVGVVALTVALGSVASAARRTVITIAGIALFAAALTLGVYSPLFAPLHRWLPGFASFRAPGRWLLVWSFALAALAAHGLDALRWRPAPAERERAVRCYALALATLGAGSLLFAWRSELAHAVHWLPHARVAVLWLGAAIATAALAITGAVTPARWPAVIVVCGLGLELLYAAREMEYNRTATSDLYAEPAAVAHFIEAVERPGAELPAARTLSLAVEERLDVDRLRRSAPDRSADDLHYAAMRDAVRPNLGTVYGLPTIDGYDGGMLPLKTYSDFKSLLIANETPVPHFTLAPQASSRPDSRLLAALGVRFLLLDGRAGAPGAGWSAREDAPGAAWLYENQERFSRAWLVGDVRAEPDPQRTLALLRGMDLRSAAVIERPVAELAGGTPITSVGAPNAAHVARYGAGIAEIEADGPGLLVLTESYYPGWHATVDGKPAPLVRADLVFHGVPLPAGAHRVRVWYDPLSIKVGIAVSVLALVLNVGLAWRARGPRRLPP